MPEENQAQPVRRIVPQPIEDELQRSYIDYAMSVIVGRALPDARDGLKPVQRRILHSMNEAGMSSGSQYKKAARVVGECFVHGTLVVTERGLLPIQDIRRGDVVYTETGQGAVTELYTMPPRPLVRITLDNELHNTATESQEFRIVNPDLSFAWRKAKDLRPGEWVVLRSEFPTFLTELVRLPEWDGKQMRLDRDFAYLLGVLMSDGFASHEGKRVRVGFVSSDKKVVARVQTVLARVFGYRPSVETKKPANSGYRTLYVLRVSRDAVNAYLVGTFRLHGLKASTKTIPGEILRSPRAVAFGFLSGLVDGDGSIAGRRRVVHYGSVSSELIDRLQVLLHHLGFHAKRYYTRPSGRRASWVNGRKVRARQGFHYLEITGDEAGAFVEELDLAKESRRIRAAKLPRPVRRLPQSSDILPYGSDVLFGELSRAHLGSGWYLDISGRKFRQGIAWPGGTKIRYSSTLDLMPLHLRQVTEWGVRSKLLNIGSPLADKLFFIDVAQLRFARVRSVRRAPSEPTYDLSISGDHNFVANGMVVHNCLGKFHPHGDLAVYDALARMVQDFSLHYPLIDGQGNWGSTEDEPAAMRYTECRLAKTAEAMLEDIEKDTVEWMDNFDGTLKEPLVLPSKFPNLLVNGSSGIAVGMATNMPPHNLNEVVDALIVLIGNPQADLVDLYNPETGPIRGPDFPTGGILYGVGGVTDAYTSGRGLISIRAKAHFEEAGRDKARIVITEIPYMVDKSALVESIALLVKSRKIEGVTDLRDESDRDGMRIVLELKRDALEDVVLNQLYHHTQMESTFGVINLALVDGKPKYLSLREELQVYLDHRMLMVRRRTECDLRKARERLHIVEGLITAVDHLDEVIRLIRHSRTVEEARGGLMSRYLLSEAQANAILAMTLRQLTGLEIEKLRQEQRDLNAKIEDLEAILASRQRILEIIKAELLEMKEKFGDERRTTVEVQAAEMEVEDLIPEEDNVIVITNSHYVKRLPPSEYRLQGRAGKGTIGIQTKDEDFVVDAFVASTHDSLLCFTTAGKVFWLKAFRIPKGSRYSRGKPIVNMLERLHPGESISAMIPVRDFSADEFLVFATRQGIVKRTVLSSYGRPLVSGIKAIRLREGDEVVDVLKVKAPDELVVVKSGGRAVRFPVMHVRDVSRNSIGVRGVKLKEGDRVVAMVVARDEGHLLTVSANGYAKRTGMRYDPETSKGFRTRSRAGLGVIAMRVTGKTGPIVDALTISSGDELLASTKKGMAIRCETDRVSEQGRNASGVLLIRLEEGDEVVAVAHLAKESAAEATSMSLHAVPPGRDDTPHP